MKKNLISKKNKQDGFTLVEMLCVIAVVTLVTSCLITGVSLCMTTYTKTFNYSVAQSLSSTISSLLSDELRYATNIETYPGSETVKSYNSITQGTEARIFNKTDGRVYIRSKDVESGACILGQSAYPAGYKVQNVSVRYKADTNLFNVYFTVNDPEGVVIKEVQFQVRPLNFKP